MIRWLQKLVLEDLWLKLFSLALAGLIWFTVKIAIKNDISPVASLSLAPTGQLVLRDIPIIILSSAAEVRAFSVSPETVDVTLLGDAASLKNLQKQDVRVLLDLSDSASLRDSRKRVQVSAPAGVTPAKVNPEEVQVVAIPKN